MSQIIILDTCVLINLLASEVIREIIRAAEEDFAICRLVKTEAVYLRPTGISEVQAEPISLDDLVDSGDLKLVDIETETEQSLYVDYAARLADGEAMTMALARAREYHLATDDRRARSIFAQSTNQMVMLSTSEIMRRWLDPEKPHEAHIVEVLCRIRDRARFKPPRDDPNFEWWMTIIESGSGS